MALKFYRAGERPPVKHLVVLIYGPPRIGKSTLALTASNALLIDFGSERATMESSESVLSIRKWDDASIDIVRDKAAQFDSIIVDSLRDAQEVLIRKLTSDDPALLHNGWLTRDGYRSLLYSFMGWIRELREGLRELNKDLVLVVNSRERESHPSRGAPSTELELNLLGRSREEVPIETDLMGRIYFDKDGQRVLTFDGSAFAICKNPQGALETKALPAIDKIDGYLATLIQRSKDSMNRRHSSDYRATTDEQVHKLAGETGRT